MKFIIIIAAQLLINIIITSLTCNSDLTKSFKLKGIKQVKEKGMFICTNISHSCCTLNDEIKIINYWNFYSSVKFSKYYNDVYLLYKNLFSLHDYFLYLNLDSISYYKKIDLNDPNNEKYVGMAKNMFKNDTDISNNKFSPSNPPNYIYQKQSKNKIFIKKEVLREPS